MQYAMARLILGMLKRGNFKALKVLSKQNKLGIDSMVSKASKVVTGGKKLPAGGLKSSMAKRYTGQRPINAYNPKELLNPDVTGLPRGTTIDDLYQHYNKGNVGRFEFYGYTGYDPKSIADLLKFSK
jgi:hypothetical protein